MLVQIPSVLSPAQLAHIRPQLDAAAWLDGRVTAGHQSSRNKNNQQLDERSPLARELGEMVLMALGRMPLFIAAALPRHVFPPLFNRYQGGESFGNHIDNAIRQIPAGAPGAGARIRTDLSATLFLSAPDDYDGGELVIEDRFGTHAVKLPAGDLVLYPATSLHRVQPVTRGARVASFFWIESMVRDDGERTLLLDLDTAIQQLNRAAGVAGEPLPSLVQLTGVYHNLLRRWAAA